MKGVKAKVRVGVGAVDLFAAETFLWVGGYSLDVPQSRKTGILPAPLCCPSTLRCYATASPEREQLSGPRVQKSGAVRPEFPVLAVGEAGCRCGSAVERLHAGTRRRAQLR